MSNDRCDICQFKDGRSGFTLLTCNTCKVHMHAECCGLTSHMAKVFQNCFACKAVGKTVEGITSKGVRKHILVEKRPEDCAVCSFNVGTHAMHPLYNDYGEDGRQLILPSGKLGWVHSLCGLVLCNSRRTTGTVYGCDVEGNYEEDNGIAEGRPAGAVANGGTADPTDVSVHRFVICGEENPIEWNIICEHRNLTCIGCGKKDPQGYRIPVQCTAGDEDEFKDFADKHSDIDGACFQAMHIGCAMWGQNRGDHRRIFFFPGYGSIEPVVELYCPKHAADVNRKKNLKVGGLTREHNHTMVGYENPDNVIHSKRGTETKKLSSHISARKRDSSTLSVLSKQPPKRVARTNSAIERRLKAKSQAALASKQAAEKRGGTPIPLNKRSNINLAVAHRSSSNTSLLNGSNPKKSLSPALSKGMRMLSSINVLQAPDLSIPKKQVAKPKRSVDIYAAAADAILNTQNTKRRPFLFPKSSTRELPPPPAYQRTSTNVGKTKKALKEAKRSTTSMDHAVDDNETPAVVLQEAAGVPVKPETKKQSPRLRRRYLSESKSNEEYYDDDFDWVGAMISDMDNIIAISVHDGNDLEEVVEARRYFWKQRSGILSSDFLGMWEKVMDYFSSGLIGSKGSSTEASAPKRSGLIEFHVDPNKGLGKGENKWAGLWNDQASLFEFGDWDTSEVKLKRSKDP